MTESNAMYTAQDPYSISSRINFSKFKMLKRSETCLGNLASSSSGTGGYTQGSHALIRRHSALHGGSSRSGSGSSTATRAHLYSTRMAAAAAGPASSGRSFVLSANNNVENTRASKRNRVKSSIGIARQHSLIVGHSGRSGKENSSPFMVSDYNDADCHSFADGPGLSRANTCDDFCMSLKPAVPESAPAFPVDLNLVVDACYGRDIDLYLKNREKLDDITGCLKKHKITPQLRAKMIDWMIEVLTNFNCDQSTFFLAVQIMDQFLAKTERCLQPQDIHLLGVTTMFIASKYEDYYPLKMSIIHEKIGHRKLSKDSIKSMEREVLKTLDYNICCPTVLERMEKLCMDFMGSQDKWVRERVRSLCIFLAKAAKHDYESNCFPASTLGVAVVFLAFKMYENAFKVTVKENWEEALLTSKDSEDDVSACCQRLYNLSQNFDTMFPGLENLKRNHKVNFPKPATYQTSG